MFEGRLPAHLQDRAPRIVVNRRGHEVWEFDGQQHSQVGMNAVVGRRPETVQVEPFRFDQMRPGLLRRRRPRRATWTSTACGRRSASRR